MKKETLEAAIKIQEHIQNLLKIQKYLNIENGSLDKIELSRFDKKGDGDRKFSIINEASFFQLKMLELIPEEIKYLEKRFQDLVDYGADSGSNELFDKELRKEWDEFLGTPGITEHIGVLALVELLLSALINRKEALENVITSHQRGGMNELEIAKYKGYASGVEESITAIKETFHDYKEQKE